jgi:DNA-binding CsgD family transcriptional regulator
LARKSAGTLEQQRRKIKRNYKRGSRTEKIVRGEASLSETEKYVAQEIALHLKAADFSWTYIGESLGISPNTVKSWFNSDDERGEELRAKLVQVSTDFVAGGIKLMKTYFIELVEMLAGIARETDDEKIVLEIFREFADRIGAVKVNKSESAALNLNRNEEHVEVDITDKTGLVGKLAKASPEVQQAAAEKMADLMALVSEGVVED